MNPIPELIPLLKQLRLSGILDSLEALSVRIVVVSGRLVP